MIDVKKLIVGFLILAFATGASALVISTIGGSSSPAAATAAPSVAIDDAIPTSTPLIGGNAFIPQPNNDQNTDGLADVTAPAAPTVTATSSDDDQNNLTDALADSYLGGVIGANPSGPTFDTNGDPVITPPDLDGVANVVAEASATQELAVPNWDNEAASQPILVAKNATPSSTAAYYTALNDVLSNHFNGQVESILSNPDTADNNELSYVQTQMQEALGDTLALETPPSLVNFQKDLVKIFVYDKNFFQLLTLAQTDPVKASLIFNDEDNAFQLAQQDFQQDSQEIVSSTVSLQQNSASPSKIVAMVDSMLGIQTANAQWAVFDPATWSLISENQLQNIETQLENELKNTLLQILKNTLIALVQRKVLVWIQGSGAPRFITNWSTQLVTAYTQTALSAINSAFTCTYPGFAPQLKVTLKVGYQSGGSSVCANTFAAALGSNSFQQFQNSFKNGSWLAFSVSSMPSNNYYGSLFFGAQIVDYNGQQGRNASQAKSVASQGGTGDQLCADGSNPNGISYYCTNASGKDYTSNSPCPGVPGSQQTAEANNGYCANGQEPHGTTPGIFTVTTMAGTTPGATTEQLAAANSIVGLLNAVTGSLINGLASAAVSAAGNAVNGFLSVSPNSVQGGGTAPAPTPLACNPATQTIPIIASTTPPATIGASGGTPDASGNFPTYNWLSSDGATSSNPVFSHAYTIPGTYTVTLSDSASDTPVTCGVTVQ